MTGLVLNGKAVCCMLMGNFDEAETFLLEALNKDIVEESKALNQKIGRWGEIKSSFPEILVKDYQSEHHQETVWNAKVILMSGIPRYGCQSSELIVSLEDKGHFRRGELIHEDTHNGPMLIVDGFAGA